MTIKKISEIAGVSQAAVSLALNNKPGVSEETRNMIIEIANKYGYNKKQSIQSKNILFVKYVGNGAAVEQNGDFIARVIDSIEQTSGNLGYNLIIKNVLAAEFQTEIRTINFDEYVGVVFLGTEATTEDLNLLQKVASPIVVVDNMFASDDVDCVVMDNCGGIHQGMEHLVNLGHTKIGYIDSIVRFSNFDHRTEAYYKGIQEFSLEANQPVIQVSPNLEGAYADFLNYLSKWEGELPTAFMAANDTIAIGAVKAFKEFGLEIPNQVSIIGFDDMPFCTVLDKALTTIRVHKERMGSLAVHLLDNKINDPSEGNVKMLVVTKLVERESVMKLN